MTEQPSLSDRGTPTPSPESVRRSLRALAEGSHTERRSPASAVPSSAEPQLNRDALERTVRDADRALPCAREAAAFLAADRLGELERAVDAADRRGETGIAARGRRALTTLRRLDAALTDGSDEDPGAQGRHA